MSLSTQHDRPYPLLTASLENAPIIKKGDYDYFVHPLSDGIPLVEPEVLEEGARGILQHLEPFLADVDKMLTAEAMGLPLATAVALRARLPFVTARKRAYGLDSEIAVAQTTGYGRNGLWLNGIEAGDRVAIVDDVVSTGGTLRALVEALRRAGAEPLVVVAVFCKDPEPQALATELACPLRALLSCRVMGDRNDGDLHVETVASDIAVDPVEP